MRSEKSRDKKEKGKNFFQKVFSQKKQKPSRPAYLLEFFLSLIVFSCLFVAFGVELKGVSATEIITQGITIHGGTAAADPGDSGHVHSLPFRDAGQ
jgi:hypothetical protein